MTQDRKPNGEYASKPSKWGNRIFTLIIIAFFIFVAYQYNVSLSSDTQTPETTEQVKVENTDNRLEEIMNEEEFKKQTELRAKKVILDREKNEETELNDKNVQIETDRHNARVAELKEKEDALLAEAKTIQLGFE